MMRGIVASNQHRARWNADIKYQEAVFVGHVCIVIGYKDITCVMRIEASDKGGIRRYTDINYLEPSITVSDECMISKDEKTLGISGRVVRRHEGRRYSPKATRLCNNSKATSAQNQGD